MQFGLGGAEAGGVVGADGDGHRGELDFHLRDLKRADSRDTEKGRKVKKSSIKDKVRIISVAHQEQFVHFETLL